MATRRNGSQRRLTPAQRKLVTEHVILAHAIGRSIHVPITRDEKVSAANMALCEAAATWREKIGPFEHYLRPAVRRAVIHEANYIRYGRQRGRLAKLEAHQFGEHD